MTVKKDKSTPENREFWAAVTTAAKTVEAWPAWKRGESTVEPKEKPPAIQEPPKND